MLTLAVSVVNNVDHREMLHTNHAKIHVETFYNSTNNKLRLFAISFFACGLKVRFASKPSKVTEPMSVFMLLRLQQDVLTDTIIWFRSSHNSTISPLKLIVCAALSPIVMLFRAQGSWPPRYCLCPGQAKKDEQSL